MLTSCILILSLYGASQSQPALTRENVSRHPTVNITPEDVARARKRIQTDPAAKAWLETLRKNLAPWKDKSPAWVREVMPGPNACFAYGFTGCPICGSTWGIWHAATASFKNPGHVTCKKGHVLPDKDHPDPGTGYVGKDKRIHYFVGSYNAWVVETLVTDIAEPYSTLYILTDDNRAGRMAVVILDELARIYPSCDKGSWDYPSNPPSGRLDRPWYQVARVLVHLVDIYDRVYSHPAMNEPSAVEGLTRRQNIEQNMLLNGARYCYEQSLKSPRMTNGQADYLRGVLAVGIALGIPEYVTWPVDGPCGIRAMIANNVDRDGQYYETSNGYGRHTRKLYTTFAEPLLNYRGSVFPNGLNLYDDPRIEAFFLLPQMSYACLGQDTPYGDDSPVTTRSTPPYSPKYIFDCALTEYLAGRVSDPQKRSQYAALLKHLQNLSPNLEKQENSLDVAEWRLFHQPEEQASVSAGLTDRMRQLLDGSYVVGQKGMAILRLGKGAESHAAVLRFGPALNHGHLDDLNVNYFAKGYEMTYDIGYSLGSTHTQVGWARQTVSHDTVVVDEKTQGAGTTGGSLHHYVEWPGLVAVEASSQVYAHGGVDMYRRLVALADQYAIDVFRVRGGKQHDLPMHSLTTDLGFEGLKFDTPQKGSLGGEKYEWGNLQLNDGDMKGYPNKPYWNPPPGNGYGFLVGPAFAKVTGVWSATWQQQDTDQTRFRMIGLNDAQTEVISAQAPGLYPHLPRAAYAIRRRTGENLSSCFVSLWQSETSKASFPVRTIRRIDDGKALSADSGIAIAVQMADGSRDLWMLATESDKTITARDGRDSAVSQGSFARCRLDWAGLACVQLLDATRMEVAGWTIQLDTPHRTAAVAALPDNAPVIRVDAEWPVDGRYDGDALCVSGKGYSRNSPYVIRRVAGDRVELEQADTLLGRGDVLEIRGEHTIVVRTAHEYAGNVGSSRQSDFFKGKLIRTDDGGASTHIRRTQLKDKLVLDVESTAGFKVGQSFRYHDVQPGDTLTVEHNACLKRLSNRSYQLSANTDVVIKTPSGKPIEYADADGRIQQAVDGRIPRGKLPRNGLTTITAVE